MTDAPDALTIVADLRAATSRLEETIGRLEPADVARPTRLPGWTVAHLLTHLARNADAGRNLLLGLRTGRPVPFYSSRGRRDADIESGSRRPPEIVIEDVTTASQWLLVDIASVGAGDWDRPLPETPGPGPSGPAGVLLDMRLREVEIHNVDLDLGYTFSDTPAEVVERLLDDTTQRLGRRGFAVQPSRHGGWTLRTGTRDHHVEASQADMLAWLSGRSDGSGVAGDGALPPVPSLG